MVAPAKYINGSNGIHTISEIVLMEDEDIEDIIKVLKSIGCKVRVVGSSEEAIELAENKSARFFILDIRMGKNRETEGLYTLEVIKRIDENNFVAVYTAYPERYESQAKKIGADIFIRKSGDVTNDIYTITAMMLPRALAELGKTRTENKELESTPHTHPRDEYSGEFSVNYMAYRDSLIDEAWFAENLNHYVAFVNGVMVGRSKNRDHLLTRLMSEHPNEPKFYALVLPREEEEIEDLPSPLFIEDY